jgi:LysM repeat protein
VGSQEWRRFVAPAAFLLAVTIAVVLVHSGIESGGGNGSVTIPAAPSSAPKRVATSTTSTTTAKPAAPTRRFWTVRAGDTFGVISAASGVPVATIEQLNPKASSTSLFIGEKLRLR